MTLKTLPVIHPPQQPPPQPPPPPPQQPSILSWIFIDTRRRFLIFVIFSPVLLPILCLSFPLICLARVYTYLRQRRRRSKRRLDDGGGLRRCEEGRGMTEEDGDDEEKEIGWFLMQRYLEDQLGLVGSVVAVYDCGDDDDEDDNLDENRRPLLV